MAAPIDFYFDLASPYAYLGSLQIDELAARHGRTVRWRPIMLGAMFKAVGTGPLMQYPLKGDYSARDLVRCARLLDVPIKMPPGFPHFTLPAARGFYWLEQTGAADTAKALAQAFYAAYFGEGRDVSGADETAIIAAGLGVEREAFLAAIQDPDIKARLKDETNAALERGVFGAPFFFSDDEPFWGHDRMDQLERWLGTGGW